METPDGRIEALNTRIFQLERELSNARAPRTATTNSELERYVSDLLPIAYGLPVSVDADDEELTITIPGVGVDRHGQLVRNTIEFEVEGTITIPVRLTVRATSEDEAEAVADNALARLAVDVDDDPPTTAGLDEVEHAEFDETAFAVQTVREV